MERALIWSGEGEDQDGDWHVEFAAVELGDAGLRANGTQLGAVPVPYRLQYRLDATGEDFVTRSLHLEATGAGWERRLRLERDPGGEWAVEVGGAGEIALPAPGGDADPLEGALDCDLGLSPLTNAMPVHRHRLDREPGSAEFVMAWVSVPDLAVHASRQRYEHLARGADGGIVRFESLDGDEVTFTSDLEFDADSLIRVYPKLARRIDPDEQRQRSG
ncbi:MAG TPA: putative glycolipid-binding domain-containing protein [Solirubrobacterales bacterium]|jgi:uncharacterized protein|nr:putative glycolipid-binding domain-containing protein [Solirubrobacterales bacterium]